MDELIFDRRYKAITRFDMVAVEDFYGMLYGNNRNDFCSGRTPLGVAFRLIDEISPTADRKVRRRGLKDRKWMDRDSRLGIEST